MNRRTMAKSKIRDFFVWTDDEVELLLKITHEYKALKAAGSHRKTHTVTYWSGTERCTEADESGKDTS